MAGDHAERSTLIIDPSHLAAGYYYGDSSVVGGIHHGRFVVVETFRRDGDGEPYAYRVLDPRP